MADRPYPDVRRGLKTGLVIGTIAGLFQFFMCVMIFRMDPISPVSLCYVFRPWWRLRTWEYAGAVFLFFFLVVGILAALRPPTESAKR